MGSLFCNDAKLQLGVKVLLGTFFGHLKIIIILDGDPVILLVLVLDQIIASLLHLNLDHLFEG